MRRASCLLLVLLGGCAQSAPAPVVSPGAAAPAVPPPACPSCLACPPPPAPEVTPAVVVTPVDPEEAARVLGSLFPKRLKSLRECKTPRASPVTWVEVDDLALRNLDSGQFVPVVERREVGAFVRKADEVRYVIRLDNCATDDDETFHVEAVFDAWSLEPHGSRWRRPRPILQREWGAEDAP